MRSTVDTIQAAIRRLFATVATVDPTILLEDLTGAFDKDDVIEACQRMLERGEMTLDREGYLVLVPEDMWEPLV